MANAAIAASRRLIAVDGRSIFVVAVGQRPEPRHPHGRGGGLQDAADNSDVREHVVIVVIPLARRTAGRGALEDQRHVRALAARNPRGVNYPG